MRFFCDEFSSQKITYKNDKVLRIYSSTKKESTNTDTKTNSKAE